jgi:hypothetical protein
VKRNNHIFVVDLSGRLVAKVEFPYINDIVRFSQDSTKVFFMKFHSFEDQNSGLKPIYMIDIRTKEITYVGKEKFNPKTGLGNYPSYFESLSKFVARNP